ncbi:MAG: Uma2 family endonuclease [Bacteroidota bacterium]
MPDVLLEAPPRVETLTSTEAPFEAFEALPEGTSAQYFDGQIHMSPAPRLRHQDVVQNLYAALRTYAEAHGGYAALAPVDVYLAAETVVQPDVLYVTVERRDRLSERGVEGAPTLVAEVLSPSTAYLDLSRKRRLYEAAGVDEYWILDPEEQAVEVLARTAEGLRTATLVYERGTVASAVLSGFEAEAADLFARP